MTGLGWGALVLGSDTVVLLGDRMMGKPDGAEGALEMLTALNGRTHRVVTGVALAREGRILESGAAMTEVTFAKLVGEGVARVRRLRGAARQGGRLRHPGPRGPAGGKGERLLLQRHGPAHPAHLADAGPYLDRERHERRIQRQRPRRRANRGLQTAAKADIGTTLREARQAANIDANKLCSDLRISPQTLEALEQGNYHLLPGDPYIRALLGSHRPLPEPRSTALVQSYNKEIGAVHAAPSIAPYKDRTQTHTATHKQIFIGIFAVLFIVLFLLFRKLNVDEAIPPTLSRLRPPGAADTLALAAQDTLLESKSLAPDSSAAPESSVPAGAAPGAVPAPVAPAVPGATSHRAAPAAPAAPAAAAVAASAAPIDSSNLTLAVVKPLIDSVGVKVMRSGKEDFATLLRLGKQMQVSHTDTIVILISKRRAVEVTLDGKTVIPDRKRFKIYGTTLKTF